jgi:biopolymer transport protein ExbB
MELAEALRDSWYQVLGYMAAGGPVMWPLALVSVVMWFLIIDRALFIGRLYRQPLSFEEARRLIERKDLPHKRQKDGALGRLVTLVLLTSNAPHHPATEIIDPAVRYLQRSLTNHLTTIGVLAAVAPLLGLLGTVTGMIATFDVLAIFGTGNAKAMAGGISEALITTQTGLLVAIPGLYMRGFLERRAANLARRLSAAGLYLQRHLPMPTTPASAHPPAAHETPC